MDFDLATDQLDLRDAAASLLADLAAPSRVRQVVDAGTGADPELWKAVVDQGWLAVAVPEALGGIGLGTVELAVLAEQVGAHVAPIPFVETALAAVALADAAERGVEDAGGWLDLVLSGEAGACVAGVEPGPTSQPCTADGDRVTGRLGPVIGAPDAVVAVVAAAGELWLVPLEERPPAEPAMDRTRRLGWLDLDGARAVPLGGADAVERLLDAGAALAAAELLGASQRMLDLTVEYARDRHQFGRPIGSFQAVKHRCADMLVDVEGMRSAAYYAAWCVSVDDPERSVAASTAKIWCSDAARRVMASGLQVHGGIGFTWEHDVHLYLKRAHLTGLSFGTADAHRRRLLGLLRARVAAGESVV